MGVEIKVPTLGESVTQATVSKWFKKVGEAVAQDEPLVEIETDKVTVEVNAPAAGALASIAAPEGSDVQVGALLGVIEAGAARTKSAAATATPKPAPAAQAKAPPPAAPISAPAPAPVSAPAPAPASGANEIIAPAVRKLIEEHRLDPSAIPATGPGGRLTKADVLAHIERGQTRAPAARAPLAAHAAPTGPRPEAEREERVRMTRLRRIISERLKESQNTAAMLTTYNEVDMGAAMDMRAQFKDTFEKKHGTRLGFMSFFVRASCIALKEWPPVNAEISGDEIVYKNYYHIGVAVGSPQGLVVPVLRDADRMSFADIEKGIADFGRRARDGKLAIAEMMGGTFTISNGGVYGSLLSMPILNPPQSGIMGMHKIEKRPRVVGDEIKIRPMMYIAMTYDHRIVDGREAVSFLARIKELVEDPSRIMIDV
ncbi:MAG: 2-oxoglutarate dehydrogenase complex dihydrolipoyllysine-residue succinyltransferase [Rhodospirillales bacterium]|nr:2-oxoglutarate dehydrogenase complex dihydrolipoyllysine-residue succinyltransferase [Rhodospirillales bacterium]MSP80163.1 2-oxoglutarate dehydrogenase complex dihydrolipoyllysine-residue succinyltransferase [Rhodospirillales bacterium]